MSGGSASDVVGLNGFKTWVRRVAFCETEGLPLDFVSTHHYPTDALRVGRRSPGVERYAEPGAASPRAG